jgi:hypothetical protein
MGPQRYDFETQEMTEIRQVIDYGESFPAWRLLALIGWIKIAMGATMFARAAVAIHAYHPSLGALGLARHILENIDHDQLRFKIDVDGKQLPPEMKWAGRTYCADSAVNWLWAYWQARATYGEHWSQEA